MVLGPALAGLSAMTLAAVPPQTTMQGQLTNGAGLPASDGAYTLVVGIYASLTAPLPVWKDIFLAVPVSDGRFAVRLGAAADPPLAAPVFAEPRWVGVAVQGEPELPRSPFDSVPYAFVSEAANTAALAADLACTGSVGAAELAPKSVTSDALALGAVTSDRLGDDVWSLLDGTFFPRAGGIVDGPLTVSGTLTLGLGQAFAGKPITGFRFENATSAPVT